MSTVTCSRCGTIAPSGAEYCVACGWSLRGEVRPLPAAVRPRARRGPLGRRVLAWVLDALLRAVATYAGWLIGGAAANGWLPDRPVAGLLLRTGAAIALGGLAALAIVITAGLGATPGQRVLGVALRTAATDERIGFWRALARALLFWLAAAIVIGPFTVFFDADRQGWHGRATGTRAVSSGLSDEPAAARPEAHREEPTTAARSSRADDDWVLELDDGRRITVVGAVLLGRDPAPQQGERVERLLPLADGSVSKTHALVDVDAAGMWVTDRWSTNGSAIIRGDVRTDLRPAERVAVPAGTVLVLGDRRILVSRGADA